MWVTSTVSVPVSDRTLDVLIDHLLLLLLLNVFDDAPVCRHVKDESWVRAVTWRTTEMQVSKDEYVMTV